MCGEEGAQLASQRSRGLRDGGICGKDHLRQAHPHSDNTEGGEICSEPIRDRMTAHFLRIILMPQLCLDQLNLPHGCCK